MENDDVELCGPIGRWTLYPRAYYLVRSTVDPVAGSTLQGSSSFEMVCTIWYRKALHYNSYNDIAYSERRADCGSPILGGEGHRIESSVLHLPLNYHEYF